MRKHYDFSNAVKNPHAGRLKDGYTIVVHHKDYDEIITVSKSRKPREGIEGITEAPGADIHAIST